MSKNGLLSKTDSCPNLCSESVSKKGTVVRKGVMFFNYFSLNICIGIMNSMAKGSQVTEYESRDLINKLNASCHSAEGG